MPSRRLPHHHSLTESESSDTSEYDLRQNDREDLERNLRGGGTHDDFSYDEEEEEYEPGKLKKVKGKVKVKAGKVGVKAKKSVSFPSLSLSFVWDVNNFEWDWEGGELEIDPSSLLVSYVAVIHPILRCQDQKRKDLSRIDGTVVFTLSGGLWFIGERHWRISLFFRQRCYRRMWSICWRMGPSLLGSKLSKVCLFTFNLYSGEFDRLARCVTLKLIYYLFWSLSSLCCIGAVSVAGDVKGGLENAGHAMKCTFGGCWSEIKSTLAKVAVIRGV